MILPTTRHVIELIEHAENHIRSGENSDLKFALIHTDNSIEIMMKEHLRYVKNKPWGEIDKKGFHSLLADCEDIDLIKNSKAYFQAYHDIRNSVYHTGTLVPPREDVESSIGLAKTLFNELHPDNQLKEAKVDTPSKAMIGELVNHIGPQSYLTEISMVKEFYNYLYRIGYKVTLEYSVDSHMRADLVAEMNNELVICEFKSGQVRKVALQALRQLMHYQSELKLTYPWKNIEGWLISSGSFTESVKKMAKNFNIRLIDGEEFNKLIKKG